MAPSDKRPNIHEVTGKPRSSVNPPRVLDHIQQQALESSAQLLEHMFSATDDLFYDLSKRASSNNEENLYFESMREIRIKKQGVINSFLRSITESFNDLIMNRHSEEAAGEAESAADLSIVEGDDLEVDLAKKNMAGRTREAYKEELYELTIRLDHLLLQVMVNEDTNPLDPRQLTHSFIDSAEKQLQISIKARLILFKLFEKHVLKQLGHIYSDANQVLIEAGILPKVPKNLNKTGSNRNSPEKASEETPPEEPVAAQPGPAQSQISFTMDIDSLNALMASARASHSNLFASAGSQTSGPHTYYLYSSNPGPTMALPELVTLLTKSQPLVDRQLSSLQPKNIVADVINQLLSKRDPHTPQALNQLDEDVINLVAMFFDNILEDENLPLAVQSIICRLQIPVLKVALRNKDFLTNPDHPARKLINTITEAGIGFDENKPLERDPLYRKIVDGIQTINRLYKADESVFTEVQQELETLVKNEQRKATIVERRTNQTEEGKSKIKYARASAQAALYDRMKDAELPSTISEFLTNTWLQVLVITHLKHGKGSAAWIEMEQLVTDIIWLCQPHTDARSKQRKARLQPEILQRIESGLEAAIDNPDTRMAKISVIESTLEELEYSDPEDMQFRSLDNEQKQTLGKSDSADKSWEEMTALERQQSKYEELSNKYFQMAKDIPEGTWVEYFDKDTTRQLRCKLSAKIDADTYIFVNRFGLKLMEKSRRQFAYDMQFSRAKPLDTRPIFERIMTKIVSSLKSAA